MAGISQPRVVAFYCFIASYLMYASAGIVQHEQELYSHLLENYNRNIRPILNATDAITVGVGLTLTNVIDVNEAASTVEVSVWMRHQWTDPLLQWEPAEHNNLHQIKLQYDQIWVPDIHLYNDAGNVDLGPPPTRLAVIYSSGLVLWIPKTKLTFSCEFDLRHFPFDEHVCKLKFGSWTYDAGQVNIEFFDDNHSKPGRIDLTEHQPHGHAEWEISADEDGIRHEINYPCCPESYADVEFKLTMKRKYGYYQCVFIAPAIFLAALVPMLFILGPSNKFSLVAAMMISLAIFSEILEEKVPVAHGSVPILSQYYMALFGMITLATILSSITANLAEKATYRAAPPRWISVFFLDCLGRFMCVKEADYISVGIPNVSQDMEFIIKEDDSVAGDFDHRQIIPPRSSGSARGQWRAIATTLDRLFFVLSVVIIVLFSFVLVSRG